MSIPVPFPLRAFINASGPSSVELVLMRTYRAGFKLLGGRGLICAWASWWLGAVESCQVPHLFPDLGSALCDVPRTARFKFCLEKLLAQNQAPYSLWFSEDKQGFPVGRSRTSRWDLNRRFGGGG